MGFTLLGKGHASPRGGDIHSERGDGCRVWGTGCWINPCLSLCPCTAQALPKVQAALDGEPHSSGKTQDTNKPKGGRLIPSRNKTCVVQHSVTRKLLPKAVSPHLSQFRVLKSLQSFFPSFSKRLPGSASAQPRGTNLSLHPWQDVRPEGGWVGGHPLPCAGGGTGPMGPTCSWAPFAAAGRASSSTERHQAMPSTTGLAVLQRGDGHPSSTTFACGIPLPPPSHPDGHRGSSSPALTLLCASRSQQHHLDFSARKCPL